MAWWDSTLERRSIQAGMRVQTQDGTRLGRVMLVGDGVLYVRPWRFSPKEREFVVPLSRMVRLTGRGVYLQGTPSELRQPVGDRRVQGVPTLIFPVAEPPAGGYPQA